MDTLRLTSLTNRQLTITSELITAYNEVSRLYESLAIEFTGYNENSGYLYLALENGITICKADYSNEDGVEYLVTNSEDGEEFFFDNYSEALDKHIELTKAELADYLNTL